MSNDSSLLSETFGSVGIIRFYHEFVVRDAVDTTITHDNTLISLHRRKVSIPSFHRPLLERSFYLSDRV